LRPKGTLGSCVYVTAAVEVCRKKKQNNNVHEEKSANFWAGWVQGAALKT